MKTTKDIRSSTKDLLLNETQIVALANLCLFQNILSGESKRGIQKTDLLLSLAFCEIRYYQQLHKFPELIIYSLRYSKHRRTVLTLAFKAICLSTELRILDSWTLLTISGLLISLILASMIFTAGLIIWEKSWACVCRFFERIIVSRFMSSSIVFGHWRLFSATWFCSSWIVIPELLFSPILAATRTATNLWLGIYVRLIV